MYLQFQSQHFITGLFESRFLPLPTPWKRGKGGPWKPPRLPCPTPRQGAAAPWNPVLLKCGEWKPPRLPCPTPHRGAAVPGPPDSVPLGTPLYLIASLTSFSARLRAAPSSDLFLPPPCADSGLPPPLPPRR